MKFLALLALAASTFLLAAPAQTAAASANVTVTLIVDYAPTAGVGTGDACDVTVPAGANGLAVLEAAKAAGCIDGYATESFGFGTFVSCLDGQGAKPSWCTLCPEPLYTPCAYWAMYFDGAYASGDVTSFSAGTNRVLAFDNDVFPLDLVAGP